LSDHGNLMLKRMSPVQWHHSSLDGVSGSAYEEQCNSGIYEYWGGLLMWA